MTRPSIDTPPLSTAIDAGFVSVVWPVDSYELRRARYTEDEDRWLIERVAVTGGATIPGGRPIAREIAALQHGSAAAVLDWTARNGFLERDAGSPMRLTWVEDFRREADQLHRAVMLLDGETVGGRSLPMDGVDPRWLHPGTSREIRRLELLGEMIGHGLAGRTELIAAPTSTGDGYVRMQMRVVIHGPLAAAYMELLAEASRIGIPTDPELAALRLRYETRTCPRCGVVFTPVRSNQRWHSRACRIAGLKAEERARAALSPRP